MSSYENDARANQHKAIGRAVGNFLKATRYHNCGECNNRVMIEPARVLVDVSGGQGKE